MKTSLPFSKSSSLVRKRRIPCSLSGNSSAKKLVQELKSYLVPFPRSIRLHPPLGFDGSLWMFPFDPFARERHGAGWQTLCEPEKGFPPVYSRIVFPQPGMAQNNVVSADIHDEKPGDFEVSIYFHG